MEETIEINPDDIQKLQARPCIRIQNSKWIDLFELIERNTKVLERVEKLLEENEE